MPFEKLTPEQKNLIQEAHPRAVFLAAPDDPTCPDLALRPLSGTEMRETRKRIRRESRALEGDAFEDAFDDMVDELLPRLVAWPDNGSDLLEKNGELYRAAFTIASHMVSEVGEIRYPKDPTWPSSLSAAPPSSRAPSETSAPPPTATSLSSAEAPATSLG